MATDALLQVWHESISVDDAIPHWQIEENVDRKGRQTQNEKKKPFIFVGCSMVTKEKKHVSSRSFPSIRTDHE